MNSLAGCRDVEWLCRRRAALDPAHSWKWLGEAERWRDLANREIPSSGHPSHPGLMAMGPYTVAGDLHT